MPLKLTSSEISEIQARFYDVINYEAENPLDPIDPATYKEPGGDSLLHIAAARGDVLTVSLLLRSGIDANILGDMGYTPLHYASGEGHDDVVELLLKSGARADIENEFGKLPKLR